MPKPACVKCQCFYRPKTNGYYVVEQMPNGKGAEFTPEERRGTKMPRTWQPYKLWASDLYECPECKHQIVVGYSNRPISEHYEPGFGEMVEAHGVTLYINDC